MKPTKTRFAAVLLLSALLSPGLAGADIFNWGADKMKDAYEEIRDNLEKIFRAVGADGRHYRDLSDYTAAVFTTEKEIRCEDHMVVSAGNLVVEKAEGCVIVSGGDVQIQEAVNTVVIADGRIRSTGRGSAVANSLLATRSKIDFDGEIADSTVYARNGAEIQKARGLTAFNTKEVKVKTPRDAVRFLEGKPLL